VVAAVMDVVLAELDELAGIVQDLASVWPSYEVVDEGDIAESLACVHCNVTAPELRSYDLNLGSYEIRDGQRSWLKVEANHKDSCVGSRARVWVEAQNGKQ